MPQTTSASFPILTTERLTLRQLLESDQEEVFELRSDQEINKYLSRTLSKTIADASDFIQKINENVRNGNGCYWAITLTDSKEFAGTICLFDFDDKHQKCEIGYELLKKYQGKGIMKEAAEKVIEYAFQVIGVTEMVASPHKDNEASNQLLNKLNFKKTGSTDAADENCVVFRLRK